MVAITARSASSAWQLAPLSGRLASWPESVTDWCWSRSLYHSLIGLINPHRLEVPHTQWAPMQHTGTLVCLNAVVAGLTDLSIDCLICWLSWAWCTVRRSVTEWRWSSNDGRYRRSVATVPHYLQWGRPTGPLCSTPASKGLRQCIKLQMPLHGSFQRFSHRCRSRYVLWVFHVTWMGQTG